MIFGGPASAFLLDYFLNSPDAFIKIGIYIHAAGTFALLILTPHFFKSDPVIGRLSVCVLGFLFLESLCSLGD